MSSSVSRVYLLESATGNAAEAELRDSIEDAQLVDWETQWQPSLLEILQGLAQTGQLRERWPENWHWDWSNKMGRIRGLLAYRTFCIVCQGATQAMMAVSLDTKRARLQSQVDKPLVYVDFLEVAPWNQPKLVDQPRFRGAGSILMGAAISLSIDEEFSGRIGLHSLPQSNDYYAQTCGMTDMGLDAEARMRYYEMTPEQAERFREGRIP